MSREDRQFIALRVTPRFIERMALYQKRLADELGVPRVTRQYAILRAVQERLSAVGIDGPAEQLQPDDGDENGNGRGA